MCGEKFRNYTDEDYALEYIYNCEMDEERKSNEDTDDLRFGHDTDDDYF